MNYNYEFDKKFSKDLAEKVGNSSSRYVIDYAISSLLIPLYIEHREVYKWLINKIEQGEKL